jgi:hypothetical protein
MRNYFIHMNFSDICTVLKATNDVRGRQLILICANIVGPTQIVYPETIATISPEELDFAEEFV